MLTERKPRARLSRRARILLVIAAALLLIVAVATVFWFTGPKQRDSWGARVNSWLSGGASNPAEDCRTCCGNCLAHPENKWHCYQMCEDIACAREVCCTLNGDCP